MIKYSLKMKNNWLGSLKSEINKAAEKAGNYAVAALYKEIIKKTNEGLDWQDRPFAPYSREYLVVRSDNGRGTKVNLQMTSQMIKSVTVSHKEGTLEWVIAPHGTHTGKPYPNTKRASEPITNAMKAYYLATAKEKRIFLKLSKVRLAYLQRYFQKGLKKEIGE